MDPNSTTCIDRTSGSWFISPKIGQLCTSFSGCPGPSPVAEEQLPHLEEQQEKLQPPSLEKEAILQEWYSTEEVGLPFICVDSSNGDVKPLTDHVLEELRSHIFSGHLTKSNLCKGCLIADGPRRIHRTVRDVDKATHVLHIDIAGPLIASDDNFTYFLVGALRLPGYPLLIDARLLQTRTSAEVLPPTRHPGGSLRILVLRGFPLTDSPRIRRLHSDKAGKVTAPFFEVSRTQERHRPHDDNRLRPTSQWHRRKNSRPLSAKCLSSSGLGGEYWSYAVRHAAQSLICTALQKPQGSPPFGSQVIAQALVSLQHKAPNQKIHLRSFDVLGPLL